MSLNVGSPSNQVFFDDEPIESILYDCQSPGPTDANAFIDTDLVLGEITQCLNAGNKVRALALMEWLLRSDFPMSVRACWTFTRCFQELVPNNPKPIIQKAVIKFRSILADIVVLASQFEHAGIVSKAGTLNYRLHEACGEFAIARTIIAPMRDRADKAGDCFSLAQLTNNFGYEYLLEGNYSEARPHFIEAIKLFESLEIENEIANARANLLTCQFALTPSRDWEALLPSLMKAQSILYKNRDWRVRKTMRLCAERAAARGKLIIAVVWARRAANASRNVATQLHQDDENYHDWLSRKFFRWKRSDYLTRTRQADQEGES